MCKLDSNYHILSHHDIKNINWYFVINCMFIQVTPSVPESKTFPGQIVGFGDQDGKPIIEIIIESHEEETSHFVNPQIIKEYEEDDLPITAMITAVDDVVQDIDVQ